MTQCTCLTEVQQIFWAGEVEEIEVLRWEALSNGLVAWRALPTAWWCLLFARRQQCAPPVERCFSCSIPSEEQTPMYIRSLASSQGELSPGALCSLILSLPEIMLGRAWQRWDFSYFSKYRDFSKHHVVRGAVCSALYTWYQAFSLTEITLCRWYRLQLHRFYVKPVLPLLLIAIRGVGDWYDRFIGTPYLLLLSAKEQGSGIKFLI